MRVLVTGRSGLVGAAALEIHPLAESDREFAAEQIRRHFASTLIVSRGVVHETTGLPGLIAWSGGARVGVASFRRSRDRTEIELVALVATRMRVGIGGALFRAIRALAQNEGAHRLWLVTTANNGTARAFYRALGLRECALHAGAVARARVLKPEIPLVDEHGAPICDEVEIECVFDR